MALKEHPNCVFGDGHQDVPSVNVQVSDQKKYKKILQNWTQQK